LKVPIVPRHLFTETERSQLVIELSKSRQK
jgi:hypothetical protein